jgi:hypothetical protein
MITPESAEKQLRAWREETEDRFEQFSSEVKKLPVKLRAIGYALSKKDPKGNPFTIARLDRLNERRRTLSELDRLSPKERLKIFSVYSTL